MAKVLQVSDTAIQCELNSGKIVEYSPSNFDWPVRQGDEFNLVQNTDGSVYIQKSNNYSGSIPLADLEEDNYATDEDVAKVATALRQQSFVPSYNSSPIAKQSGIFCPDCGSNNVTVSTVVESLGSTTISRTKTRSRKKGHGFFWWIFIGWWWWFIDLFLWIFAFFPRLIIRLFAKGWKRDKRVATSNTIETTKNKNRRVTICTCQNCGNSWER